jgi:hypothetical protein
MADTIREAEQPEPSPKPAELPRSTDARAGIDVKGGPMGSQAVARLDAEAASRAEFAKAIGGRPETEADGVDAAAMPVKYVEGKIDPREIEIYDRIRRDVGDTARISENTGIPQDKLDQIKDHVFYQQHDLATGPGQLVRANFTPDDEIANLWPKAGEGTLSPREAQRFHRLMAHEYVERGLMENGIPYRSAHPDAWSKDSNHPTPEHFGAHDLAPLTPLERGPFDHWERALGRNKPDVEIAPDLSNLDSVITHILGKV